MEKAFETKCSNDKEDERLLPVSGNSPEKSTVDDNSLRVTNTNPTQQRAKHMPHVLQHDTTGITSLPITDATSFVSTDVLQLSARPLQEETTSGQSEQNLRSQTNTEFDDIPKPHDDWKFNKMLLDLAEAISSEELTKLKSMYRDHIGKRVLEQMKNASEFFDILRERLLISRDNLLHLQALLNILNKHELLKTTIEYAKTLGNVVHFYPAPETPANGYTFAKFHVAGKNYSTCSREYINRLRHAISDLLFVEAKDVLIVGAMPSCSFFITLMIPDMFAILLEEFVHSNKDLSKLIDLDIDTIAIGGQIYDIKTQGNQIESVSSIDDSIHQQDKFENVYRQLRDKTKLLENAEIKCIDLSRKLNFFKTSMKQENRSHKSSQTDPQFEKQSLCIHDKLFNQRSTDAKRGNKLEKTYVRIYGEAIHNRYPQISTATLLNPFSIPHAADNIPHLKKTE